MDRTSRIGSTLSYSPHKELHSFSVPLPLSSHSCSLSLPSLPIETFFLSPFFFLLYLSLWPQVSRGPQMASVSKKGYWLSDESIHTVQGTSRRKNCCVRLHAAKFRKWLLWLPVNSTASVKLSHWAHPTQTPVYFVAAFLDTQERLGQLHLLSCWGRDISVQMCLLCPDSFLSFMGTEEPMNLLKHLLIKIKDYRIY